MIQLNMIQLNILPLLVALNFFFDRKKKNVKARIFVEKWLDHMLLMTLYVVAIATDIVAKLSQNMS